MKTIEREPGPWAGWTMPPRKRSLPYTAERCTELECAIATLQARQAAQPKAEVERRLVLAVLIGAFERRLELTQAGMDAASEPLRTAPHQDVS